MTANASKRKERPAPYLVIGEDRETSRHVTCRDAIDAVRKWVGRYPDFYIPVLVLDLGFVGRSLGIGGSCQIFIEPLRGQGRSRALALELGDGGRRFLVLTRAGDPIHVRAATLADALKSARKQVGNPRDIVIGADFVRSGFDPEQSRQGRFRVRLVEPVREFFTAEEKSGLVSLKDCPAGPFLSERRLGLKIRSARTAAFWVETGERIRGKRKVLPCSWTKKGDL